TLGSDLRASIKGFKKAIGDDPQTPPTNADKTSNDADFAKSITETQQPIVEAEKSKSQGKEQG
ncbi:MAG: hypothetical protein RLY17_1131, partial [Pseudomonadota bacterium]